MNGAVVAAVGRLDAMPWGGGLKAGLRGEDDVRGLLRTFAIAFAVTIAVPAAIAVVLFIVYVLLIVTR